MSNKNKIKLKKIEPLVNKVESLRSSMMALSDDELKNMTNEFKERLKKGETLDSLLPEAFAVCREASRRVLGLEPYRVQIIGAILLFQGNIAEMATGEGKTLVAAMPSYLMGLSGKGVHVVTVNDYLAYRDYDEIGKIHQFLGLTVGCVLNDMKPMARKYAYDCDITYVTNSELGFDYLRDNMASDKESMVQRGLNYAIIDEVDSILIDEARTPLIISGGADTANDLYTKAQICAAGLVQGNYKEYSKLDLMTGDSLEEDGDFIVDEKDKVVHLTENGVKKIEQFFYINNFASNENAPIQHHMNVALRANYLMHRDKDYVVADGKVQIVDEFTGRILPGRRYSDGLHQAIEAKEKVEIQQESLTMATITYQSFFNLYDRKSGMTGTAITEEKEFKKIYNVNVVSVPTNKPVIRQDLNDLVYLTKKAKYDAVLNAVIEAHKIGQPVLIGTTTIDVSEKLSEMFKEVGLKHNVLNAKFHAQEAEIISHAGEHGAITIATNMAGRGTDIKLDDEAREAGGLFVIGTERHESRRIDNQLRGRSGRQGDAGKSRFYLSLEDNTLRLFGSERTLKTMRALNMPEDEPIEHRSLNKLILNAQKKIEGNNFGIRKNVVQYDEVNHAQRQWVYTTRFKAMNGDADKMVRNLTDEVFKGLATKYCKHIKRAKWDFEGLFKDIESLYPDFVNMDKEELMQANTYKEMSIALSKLGDKILSIKEVELTESTFAQTEVLAIIKSLDMRWVIELYNLETLRESIGLIGYGQKDPLIEYQKRAYKLFEEMKKDVTENIVKMVMHAHIVTRNENNIMVSRTA